jgi:hypothetical protein
LPAIIRLGWKGLPGTNTLAYYENSLITDRKSFITLGPGGNVIKLFSFITDDARVFVLVGNPFQPSLMIVGEARSLP